MAKAESNLILSKSKSQTILEHVLFIICLCVISLRTTFTENPAAQSTTPSAMFGDSAYTLIISAILIFSFVCWLVWGFCSGRFLYRFTGIEIGLCLFCIAAIIAGSIASNKRAAITGSIMHLAPVLMAILLVQILDCWAKIKLLLIIIATLGVVLAYQCAEQFFLSNQMIIDQYEQSPRIILEPLGIQPGTLAHFLFEHRLYSREVRGFFTTSNSAGSFAILASFAAIALFMEKLQEIRNSRPKAGLGCGIAVVVVLFGLAITRSKGAVTSAFIAQAMFIMFLCFGNWLKTHKKTILIVCLLLVFVAGFAVIWYGLTNDRLPGGNSMLVRWQYWQASARMYADHPLTGVGGGNFSHFYSHYKPPQALETVADPHNFLLSILTQYGPLGLIAFLTMIFIPLWRAIYPHCSVNREVESAQRSTLSVPRSAFSTACLIIVSIVLLIIRPMIMPTTPADNIEVMVYMILMLYVAPVAAFIIGFLLLVESRQQKAANDIPNTNVTIAALFCAVLGFLIHNLIDFAIFEPGIYTGFWAIMACLIALVLQRSAFNVQRSAFSTPLPRMLIVAGGLLVIGAYFNYALVPVAKSATKIQKAQRLASYGQFRQAHNLLSSASKDDCLSPIALSLNGRLYLQRYKGSPSERTNLLLQAEKCFLDAIGRNKADFKNFERLMEVYTLLGDIEHRTSNVERRAWLDKALVAGLEAIKRYPGCGRLHLKLAQIAEQLGQTGLAIEHYQQAINIEDKYRHQFRLMYPERQIFSRLGQQEYKFAIQQIRKLSKLNSSF